VVGMGLVGWKGGGWVGVMGGGGWRGMICEQHAWGGRARWGDMRWNNAGGLVPHAGAQTCLDLHRTANCPGCVAEHLPAADEVNQGCLTHTCRRDAWNYGSKAPSLLVAIKPPSLWFHMSGSVWFIAHPNLPGPEFWLSSSFLLPFHYCTADHAHQIQRL